jgi:predicted transcriptional regulator
MATTKPRPKTKAAAGPDVLFIRVDPQLSQWIGDLADRTNRTRNEIAAAALAEFQEIMLAAQEMEAKLGSDYDPGDFIAMIGPSWCARLVPLGIAGPGMREAWRWFLREREAEARETAADRVSRAQRSSHAKGTASR